MTPFFYTDSAWSANFELQLISSKMLNVLCFVPSEISLWLMKMTGNYSTYVKSDYFELKPYFLSTADGNPRILHFCGFQSSFYSTRRVKETVNRLTYFYFSPAQQQEYMLCQLSHKHTCLEIYSDLTIKIKVFQRAKMVASGWEIYWKWLLVFKAISTI